MSDMNRVSNFHDHAPPRCSPAMCGGAASPSLYRSRGCPAGFRAQQASLRSPMMPKYSDIIPRCRRAHRRSSWPQSSLCIYRCRKLRCASPYTEDSQHQVNLNDLSLRVILHPELWRVRRSAEQWHTGRMNIYERAKDQDASVREAGDERPAASLLRRLPNQARI